MSLYACAMLLYACASGSALPALLCFVQEDPVVVLVRELQSQASRHGAALTAAQASGGSEHKTFECAVRIDGYAARVACGAWKRRSTLSCLRPSRRCSELWNAFACCVGLGICTGLRRRGLSGACPL
eukprot:1593536-Pleurochrysis_carterae.AAC.9